jgi:glycine betaine/proline transport system permease protein
MVGVNQVIMMSLNVVIIASMIGAGGLGFDVWQALQKLSIGAGLEAGLAITLMAIVLDRLSQEYVARKPTHVAAAGGVLYRWRWTIAAAFVLVVPTLVGSWVPFIESYPKNWRVSSGAFWDGVVSWINLNLYSVTDTIKTWTILNILRPVKAGLLELPWLGVVAALWVLGLKTGGQRLAWKVAALSGFVAMVGFWDRAMVSLFLVAICVGIACCVGIPFGILSSSRPRLGRAVQLCVETIQTLPTFVYLIPVVMLFGVGDFAGMITIAAYAVAPAIIYTSLGLRLVRPELIEAARTSGCTKSQTLAKVQLPLALPEMMLGVNQVIMMALSMLVIASLVGTRGLEQEILLSLSRVDAGQGLVAGLCIACIAMISDRLIGALSEKKRRLLWRMA